ncbi:hypothetical protein QE152_g32481 [Popillia japonica]|uniref:Uncharacterized protein n=1 Tax=Popillia japonica TaxID=7064 RepID=A0AAW1IYQ5_POPJA
MKKFHAPPKNQEVEEGEVRELLNIIQYEATKPKINVISVVSFVKPSDVNRRLILEALPENQERENREVTPVILTNKESKSWRKQIDEWEKNKRFEKIGV